MHAPSRKQLAYLSLGNKSLELYASLTQASHASLTQAKVTNYDNEITTDNGPDLSLAVLREHANNADTNDTSECMDRETGKSEEDAGNELEMRLEETLHDMKRKLR